MKKFFITFSALVMSLTLAAQPKPQHVVVLGDDPTMVADEAANAAGYASLLAPLFDEAVSVDVYASATLLPADADALLEHAGKGDIALLCKLPVEETVENMTMSDIYLNQLTAIAQAAKKKGVKIVWLTPVCPRYFTAEGKQVHRSGMYPDIVRRMCQRDGLPIVDVEMLTFNRLAQAGAEASASDYVPLTANVPAAEEKAAREGLLLTEVGAQQVAELIGDAIRADKKNPLNKRMK